MNGVSVPPWLVSVVIVCGLGVFLFRWLRSSGYNSANAALLSGLVLAQPAFWDFRTSVSASLFSAASGAVCFAALSFLQRHDVRRIALLGGSLAGAQLVSPLWGTVTSIMVPLALRSRLDDKGAGGLTGLYVSILFLPVLTAIGIVFLDERFQSEVWALAHLSSAHPGIRVLGVWLLPAVPLVTALVLRPWDASATIIAVVAFTLLAASIMLDLFRIGSTIVSAAFAVLSLALVAASAPWPLRRPWALWFLSTTLFVSWSAVWLARTHV